MPKILVNYKYNKKTDTFTIINNGIVYADEPIAEMDMYAEYDEILVVPINKRKTVVDKEEYMKNNKIFKLILLSDGTVHEDNQNGQSVWLPKDTDISKLRFIDDQLVLISEDVKEGE